MQSEPPRASRAIKVAREAVAQAERSLASSRARLALITLQTDALLAECRGRQAKSGQSMVGSEMRLGGWRRKKPA